MARQIDRKLRLTATAVGAVARKDLAAAFRRVNAKTSFDVGRADKWLQGRAAPRERQVYDDWAKVLDLEKPGSWIADCDLDEFVDEIAQRHGRSRAELLDSLATSTHANARQGPGLSLVGTFVCYSYAWSPYFRGRMIRGELSVGAEFGPNRLSVSYGEVLPTGRMQLDGAMTVDKRALRVEVSDATGVAQFVNFCLFPATPPASVLGGLMCGTALIGPDAQPSVSRVVMVRLPQASRRLQSIDAYVPSQASLAEDLTGLGLRIDDLAAADACLTAFLSGGGRGFDQVPAVAYRAMVDLFDRGWLNYAASAA
ncbi:hypothetical protein SAMN02745126_06118 [Enhydrobacter aerosaccus]|uniref:Uncharacterized protein n=1 Tax=Enhydrobacter aerosaccus TaxID=225324 RepID=A0A1T4TEE9_9HYPH|nr:hypothetical protein [Enhydrobacter aerosaccus]SKA38844.1 hypothetical protein SAMN02745126_06118 [Enhydrobacter aerosaccus]